MEKDMELSDREFLGLLERPGLWRNSGLTGAKARVDIG
jgi:hypothetical protein